MKVVTFIISLSNVSQPFLIITTSNSLSYWESEFSRLVPSIDVVVYSGSKYNRKCIRTLEFYGEGDRTMFQVLLSSMEAVVEVRPYVRDFFSFDFRVDLCILFMSIRVNNRINPKVRGSFESLAHFSIYINGS